MYETLVRKEGLIPFDAADRIYRDVVGIWQKDTIRRLLPSEAKDQAARERQALSRLHMAASSAGLILRKEEMVMTGGDDNDGAVQNTPSLTSADANGSANYENNKEVIARLDQENIKLRKEIEELKTAKRSLLERMLALEKSLAEEQQLLKHSRNRLSKGISSISKEDITILIPPSLFMKTYALMRSSSKPLLLKVKAGEAIDIDSTVLPR